jgi:hypothetical protein
VVTATVAVTASRHITVPQNGSRQTPVTATPAITGTQTVQASEPSLWIAYRDQKHGYGLALPCFWHITPIGNDAKRGLSTATSYDELFAMAHSVRGHWVDGEWPPGAIKIDISVFEGIEPSLSLQDAAQRKFSDWHIQSIEPSLLGDHEALVVVLADRQGEPAGSNKVHVVRLS